MIGGWFGGRIFHQYGEVQHQPAHAWWVITGVGLVTALALFIYDRLFRVRKLPGTTPGVP